MIFKEMLTCHDFFLRQVVLIVIKNIFVFDSHSIFVSLVSSKDISKEVQVRVYDSEKEHFLREIISLKYCCLQLLPNIANTKI